MTSNPRPLLLALAAALVVGGCSASSDEAPSTSPTSSPPVTTTAPTTSVHSTPLATGPVIRTRNVSGQDTVIAFRSSFVKALYTRGINTRATGYTGLDDYHRARLPITGGSATLYPGSTGLSRNTASLAFTNSGLTVYTRKVRVLVSGIALTLGAKPAISATIGRQGAVGSRVTLFDLTLTRGGTKTASGVVLGAVRATLDPDGARALNSAFATTVFSTYTKSAAGTVTVTVTA